MCVWWGGGGGSWLSFRSCAQCAPRSPGTCYTLCCPCRNDSCIPIPPRELALPPLRLLLQPRHLSLQPVDVIRAPPKPRPPHRAPRTLYLRMNCRRAAMSIRQLLPAVLLLSLDAHSGAFSTLRRVPATSLWPRHRATGELRRAKPPLLREGSLCIGHRSLACPLAPHALARPTSSGDRRSSI